jgi:hypothetical protein
MLRRGNHGVELGRPGPGFVHDLEKPCEFVHGETCFPNQRSERTFGKLFVIGNRQTPVRRIYVPDNDVASVLLVKFVSHPAKCANSVAAGYYRQFHRLETSTTSSSMPGGTGSPCLTRLFRYPSIASRMLAVASTRVWPCETQPGNVGHEATNIPSSSFSR